MPVDPRVDAYIGAQADFARPILERVRARIHAACPEFDETIKWSRPAFLYRGQLLALTAAFKGHVRVSIWQHDALAIERDVLDRLEHLSAVADLPDDAVLDAVIARGIARIAADEPAARPARIPKPALEVPRELAEALAADDAAAIAFASFPPSCRREYCDWIAEAKRPETRQRRLTETIAQLRAGKRRYDRYAGC